MNIKIACDSCQSAFRVPGEYAGKKVKCPKCASPIIVPHTAEGETPAPPTNGATSPREPAMRRVTAEEVLAAFSGPIEPVPTSLGYTIWAIVAAVIMILLPLVYIALIAGMAWTVYLHATGNTWFFENMPAGRGSFFVMLAYIAPLIAGPIAILFMLKPLLAHPAKPEKSRVLQQSEAPVLFAFVHRLCDVVGAPVPKHIEVTCDVNAAASFRRGLLSVILGNDLNLMIGMPLTAGLDLQSFAGVLGHEFGHFRQGAGMRLTYIVRSISFWFTRVVYERDEWDERLSTWAGSIDLRIGWVLYFVMLVVWLTRCVLWILMHIGNLVAGFLLRQMEFDADRCEARVAGDSAFEKTCRRIAFLSVGAEIAYHDIGAFYQEGRLVDNLPALVVDNVDEIPKEIIQEIEKDNITGKTGLFDTHPANSARIANARAENTQGVFRIDAPTSVLFTDFDGLCRDLTLGFYREVLGPQINPQDMRPYAEVTALRKERNEDFDALHRFYLGQFQFLRPPPSSPQSLAPPTRDPLAIARDIQQAREVMVQLKDSYEQAFKQFDEADNCVIEAAIADAWISNRLKLPSGLIDKKKHGRSSPQEIRDRARYAQTQVVASLEPFENAAHKRLTCAMQLLSSPAVAAKIEGTAEMHQEATRLMNALQPFEKSFDDELAFREHRTGLVGLLSQLEYNQEDEKFINTVIGMNKRLHEMHCYLRKQYLTVPYPFDHADSSITVGMYLAEKIPVEDEIGDVLDATEGLGEGLMQLRGRIHARLARIAERVERAIGLEPFDVPEPEETPEQ